MNEISFAHRFALLILGFGVVLLPQRIASQSEAPLQDAVPAFHAEAPRGPLPATLNPSLFPNVIVQNAYALAARVKKVLYQQPCYCHCDRSRGHGSLLDCFASEHASECAVCIREGLYAYEQTRKGRSAAQIRADIERGEWQHVDLSQYQTALPTK